MSNKKPPVGLEKVKVHIDRLEALGVDKVTIAGLRRWLNKQNIKREH